MILVLTNHYRVDNVDTVRTSVMQKIGVIIAT